MGFETLLGNDQLRQNISSGLDRGHISHFYLLSGPRGSGKRTLARLLSAGILCTGQGKPCGTCPHCRKVLSGTHPDVITVEDPEHKNISVKIIRQAREDVFIRPNEGNYKIYIVPQEMGIEGQNALLKILEEPPPHGVFLLLTDNPEKLLPTVRSRCTELKLQSLPGKLLHRHLRTAFPQKPEEDLAAAMERSGGFLGQALEILEQGDQVPPQTEGFIRCFSGKDILGMSQVLVPMEKWKRDALLEMLQSWLALTEEALASRTGGRRPGALAKELARSRTAPELLEAARILRKAADYCQSNVSPAAICGWLIWTLR